MKIKKIPFPPVEEVLCCHSELSVSLANYTFSVFVENEGKNTAYYMSMERNGCWIMDGIRTAVRNCASPETTNPVIRKWYEMAKEEMQEEFEADIKAKYLEEE